jgi:hypothetical protein
MPSIRLEMETLLKLADALIEKKIELGIYNKSPQRPELERRSLVDSFSPEQKKRVAEARTQILAIIEAAKRGDPSLFVRAEDVHVAPCMSPGEFKSDPFPTMR